MSRESLSGLMGMHEMEEAVWSLLCFARGRGIDFHELIIHPGDFISETKNWDKTQALIGFCQLLANGWLVTGYPNCDFYPSKGLVERMRKHGVLPPDTPDPLDMVERRERLMNHLTDREKTRGQNQ